MTDIWQNLDPDARQNVIRGAIFVVAMVIAFALAMFVAFTRGDSR